MKRILLTGLFSNATLIFLWLFISINNTDGAEDLLKCHMHFENTLEIPNNFYKSLLKVAKIRRRNV